MRLGLITYDTRHLKTEQVALGLHQRGEHDCVFYALPFVQRPAREIVFAHRPDMSTGAPTRDIAKAMAASFIACDSPADIPPDGADLFLILGAGLLPGDFVSATRGRVLNAHPGIIPLVRGLDAFKWAIHDRMPLGNTLHYIDEEADAGDVVAVLRTPVFPTDTLSDVARRHYELEIVMMLDFALHACSPQASGKAPHETARPARRRMSAELQRLLPEGFEDYKSCLADRSSPAQCLNPKGPA